MRFRVERRPLPIAPGVCALLAGLEPGSGSLLPEIQLSGGLDPITAILSSIVGVGLLVILLLVIAFIRAGPRPQRPAPPEEGGPAGVRGCPRCGHVITRPEERFCIQCGARLPA
jgi:hypothetical protein